MQSITKTKVFFFTAPWCRGCGEMIPVFRAVEKELRADNMKFFTIDVETKESVELSIKHQVRNVPTILIMKGGQVVERIKGFKTKEQLKDILDKWK